MEKLSMCRVCLEEDIRLLSTVETHLQEMYDSLVLMPFETKDRRPILVCYICCARLKNCYNLRRSCLQSEELFTQMHNCAELEPVQLQRIDNQKRLTVHHVEHFSKGHVLQMSVDNVGVETLTFDYVKVEKDDPEDIDEDALEENSVYDNIQSADSDYYPLTIVKEEESGGSTSDPTPKESEQTVQWNPEDLTSSNLKEHEIVQDKFKQLNKVPAEDKTAAKNTYGACQQCYSCKCEVGRHIRLCSDAWKEDLSRENSTCSHTHTSQGPHQCHVCKKHFSFMSKLSRHMRTHTGEKPYCCDICKKEFSQKGALTNHMSTHTGEKPHQCHVCKKSFSCMSLLTRHIRTHTGEKPYQCDTCKKQFSLRNTLTKHMRTHTGEKPYHCHICNKQFSLKTTLSNHIRTHTGEKPYQCNMCKKQFTQMSNLNYHTCTHTGEKPHQCDLCKKCFSDRSSLKNHYRTHKRKHYKKNTADSSSFND